MDEILRFMTEYMNERSDIEVALVGLRKDQDGVSLVKLIGCPATCLDPEHWCCIMMPFTERMVGGARGLRTRYQVTYTHCQPVRNLNFPNTLLKRHCSSTDAWSK